MLGESESRIRQALKDIEKTAPVYYMDRRNWGDCLPGEGIQSNIAHHQVLAILLEWMQEHDKDIFIVATANGVKNIPKELIRPGRFSKNYLAEMPNKETREKIFDIYLNKIGIEYDSNILAEQKRTGAEIEAKSARNCNRSI